MKSIKPRASTIKTIRNFTLIALAAVFFIYVVLNIIFWKKGMPERFFEYELSENDTVEIKYYSGAFFLLNIPETIGGKPVTSIGGRLLSENDKKHNIIKWFITSVHLPDTVEEIHISAFYGCTNLRTINIPAKLKFAGARILSRTKVRSLVFPEGITEIGCGYDDDMGCPECILSFADMNYLSDVVFPESLKKIGNNAFSGCSSLKKITLPNGIEEMGFGAFQDSGLTQANIPKSLVKNCGCAFRGTPFEKTLEKESPGDFVIFNDVLLYKYFGRNENAVIPEGIESICDRAFETARNTKTVEIPESVRYINDAFECSSVESLIIPDTVDMESGMSFGSCYKLKKITLPDKMTKIPSSAFSECVSLESIQLPESMRVIGSHAFYRCESLERIVIPKSVEEIESYAFGECKALKEVIIEGSPRIDEAAFENCTALENKPKQ